MFKPSPDAFETKNITEHFEAVPKTSLSNIENRFADIVIWLSEQAIPEDLFKHKNVLFFMHGFDGTSTEGLLGYQEFFKKQEVITSTLVFKSVKKTLPKMVSQTWSTMPSMSIARSRNEHMWKLVSLLVRSVTEMYRLGIAGFQNKQEELKLNLNADKSNQLAPTTIEVLFNLVNHFYRLAYKCIRNIFYKEQWILLLNTNNGPSTDFSALKKILPPKDRFWADPFLINKDGKQYLFFEELPFSTWKGHLSVMEIDDSGTIHPAVKILEKPYHLSYPFIFEFEDKYFMIPESFEAGSIQLYECMEFPYKWEFKMNLMTDVRAFDTTLYFYNDKWWLFTVLTEQKGGGHNDELFLFYADSPISDNWESHPKNPIISDVRLARPAGNLYEENGKLIRPSQDCARKYGFGFNLNEIEVLTETDYRERRILHVRPDWDKSLTRTHSFNHVPGMTVLDAVIQRSRFF